MSAREGTTCCVEADRTERHHGYPLEEPATRTILPSLIPRRRPVEAPASCKNTPGTRGDRHAGHAQEDSEDLCVLTCRRASAVPVDTLRQLTPGAAPRQAPSQDSHHHCRYRCRLRWALVLATGARWGRNEARLHIQAIAPTHRYRSETTLIPGRCTLAPKHRILRVRRRFAHAQSGRTRTPPLSADAASMP